MKPKTWPQTWPLAGALALLAGAPALAAEPIGYAAGGGDPNTVPVSPQNPLPVAVAPSGLSGATSTDASGAIATGGAYQTVLAANPARRGCLIQNPATATEVLNVKVGSMTTPFTLPVGGSFSCAGPGGVVATDAISVSAATAAHAFAAVTQ